MPGSITHSPTRDVLFVIAPHSLLLDIAGPAEAFRLANLRSADLGRPPPFRLRFAAPETTALTSVGLSLAKLEPLPRALTAPTWVVVVGQPLVHMDRMTKAFVSIADWLKRLLSAPLKETGTPHRLVTICSGTLLAARAGLADGRRCTTHHDVLEQLRRAAPRAHVVDNRVFVIDGALASSAGITAGIDLALHLIAQACGEALAANVAEDMVVYLRRSSGDAELSPFLAHRGHMHSAVHKVQDALNARPEKPWDMAAMTAVAHVTARHLLRLFQQHAGVSPLHYLQAIRLERARQSLERGASVTRAAEMAGFRSSLHLRRAWTRKWGGSPRDVSGGSVRQRTDVAPPA